MFLNHELVIDGPLHILLSIFLGSHLTVLGLGFDIATIQRTPFRCPLCPVSTALSTNEIPLSVQIDLSVKQTQQIISSALILLIH